MKFFLYIQYFFRSAVLRGFVNTLRLLLAEATHDKKLGISTAAIKKSRSGEFYHYQGAGYLALLHILQEVFKSTPGFAFVDIGCGKGRAVFAAEFCGYDHITGIELDAELLSIASANLSSYAFKRGASHISFVNANALNYAYKNTPAVYFFFNPFNETVMRGVLAKIIAAGSAETWFIYMNPLHQAPFVENNMQLVKEFKTGRYLEAVVYRLTKTSQEQIPGTSN